MVSGGRRGSIILAGERKGSSSHSGEWRGSGVLSGASSLLHLGRAAPGQRENTETVAKLPQPAQPRHHAWGARPEDHAITNYYNNFYTAPSAEGIIIIRITLYTLYYYKVR